MTPRQMYRAMRKWNISIVCDDSYGKESWYAGQALRKPVGPGVLGVTITSPVNSIYVHAGVTPEMAVEDYCNARNLEWDV